MEAMLHQLRHAHATEMANTEMANTELANTEMANTEMANTELTDGGFSLATIRKRLGHRHIQRPCGTRRRPTRLPKLNYRHESAGDASRRP